MARKAPKRVPSFMLASSPAPRCGAAEVKSSHAARREALILVNFDPAARAASAAPG